MFRNRNKFFYRAYLASVRGTLSLGNSFAKIFGTWGSIVRQGAPYALLLTLLPLMAAAAPTFPFWGSPLVSCNGNPNGPNPCTSLCDLINTFQNIVYFGITLAVFVVAPVFLLWGGIMMIVAGGSEERWRGGKRIVAGTIVGLLLALGSFVIVNTVLFVIGAKSSPTGNAGVAWPNISCKIQCNPDPVTGLCKS